MADIDSIETPDPLTVVFHLKRSNRAIVYAFANPFNCVYSAAKLKQDPTFPVRNVLGTGPFRFVEHVAGSHWKGERFKEYFKPGLPYLDGFRAIFTQGPALINALQGEQIMADFRSVTTADRDRLVQALGNKIVVRESPWLNTLLVTFNTQRKPFDDARAPRAVARDRPLEGVRGAAALHHHALRRRLPAPRLRSRRARRRPGENAGLLPEYRSLAGRGEAPAGRGRRPQPEGAADQPHDRQPVHAGGGVYVIDQWRQIGVETEHIQANDVLYNTATNEGNFDVALDFQGDSIDEPTYQLTRYLSVDISSNRGRYTDRDLDQLFEAQKDATDPKERYRILREFETRMLTQAYQVPLLWWQRIVVMSSRVKGWGMTPSHLIGQDLEKVWLKP